MEEWEDVAIRILILETPEGRLAGSLQVLLKFPFQIEKAPVERQAQFAQNKLVRSKQWLERIKSKGGGSSAPDLILQTANQPSPAATTGGSSAAAPNLQTAYQTWPAAAGAGSIPPGSCDDALSTAA